MDKDKVNPHSQAPSPSPGWLEGQALSRQGLEAGGGSGLPLSDAEEQAFANMEEEWEYYMDQELSQWEDIASQELCLWEEVTVQEFCQQQEEVTVQEVFPHRGVRHQEWHQREVGVRLQWEDGTQQEQIYPWEESGTVQELSQWDKQDETYQELSHWEGEEYQELSSLEEDMQGLPHMHLCKGDKKETELSHVGDNSNEGVCQGKDYSMQKLAQWEKESSDQNLSQREESVSRQGLSQWRESIRYKVYEKPMHLEREEDAQICAQQGPRSPSSVGTQVAGEAARELLSASPALRSATGDELAAAAAALAGAAKEVEEPLEPLAPEVEKAPGSPAHSEEVPSAGTESPVLASLRPSSCNQALLDLARHIVSEVVLEAMLEVQASGQQPEEREDLEQNIAAELEAAAPGQREESPTSSLHSPCCTPSPLPSPPGAQALSEQQEEADRGSVLAEEESGEGTLAEKAELSQGDNEESPEVSQGEMGKYQEESQGEACTEQEVYPRDAGSYLDVSQEETSIGQQRAQVESMSYEEEFQEKACTEQALSHTEASSYQEGSQVRSCTQPELFLEEPSSHQEGFPGESSLGQELAQVESMSYQEEPQGEACTEQDLSLEAVSHQEGSQGEASTEQELSKVESRSYQEGSQGETCTEQEVSQAETGRCQDTSQGETCNEQELSLKEAGSYHELSDWDEYIEEELSHGDLGSYQEVSDWEEYTEQGLSQGQVGSSNNLPDWDEYSEHELSPGDVGSYQEVSDWEESIDQKLSQEENSIGQEGSEGNGKRPSAESSWRSDSGQDLAQDSWEPSTEAKHLLREEDEWDEISELCEDGERRLAGLRGGELFVPAPREAWIEFEASELSLPGLPCASPPHVAAPALRGRTASLDFQEQVPETETLTPVIALCHLPSPSAPHVEAQEFSKHQEPRKKRPSRLRRALGGLFHWLCLGPQPKD